MSAEQRALTDLAASVADGEPIDWDGAQAAVGAEHQALVRHLRLVSSVAELYRTLPVESPEETAAGTGPKGPRWGNLVVMESLGRGTTAEVFRAWDLALHREVALKLFPPDDGGRQAHGHVLSEARRLARVRHPNVATVYGAERHGDRVGFWMELVRGASLDDTVSRQGPFGAREAALIGSEIASALAAVHSAGLLHRDVKAQNVLREEGGRIVLTDFGTGEEVNAPGPARMAGTPVYLAPEVLRGRSASVQSDIYSLAVLLFFITTGKFPIEAASMMDLVRGHAEGRRRRLRDLRPDLPSSFTEVVERALDEITANRFASAGALENALRRSLESAASPLAFMPEESAVPAPHRPLLYLAFAAVMVLVIGLPSWKGTITRSGQPTRVESLAVLPLVDATRRNPQLADAMTDQLIATLGQIGALRVTTRSSVQPLQEGTSPAEIAHRLGVDAVLEATMSDDPRFEGRPQRIQITARLLAAGSGAELWSGTFDTALGTIAAVETTIAKSIARSIRVAVSPQEADRLRSGGRTSPQAEEAYFQGRYHLGQYGVDSARRALVAFQRTIMLDPGHASAHAALARTYVSLGFNGALSQAEARARALEFASRAAELDPEDAEAQVALADLAFYYDWNWTRADAGYLRGVDLNPSGAYARSQYARYLAAAGRVREAVEHASRAVALDPLSAEAAQSEGLIRYYARDFAGAEKVLQRAISIDPAYARAYYVLGRVHEAQGRIAEALEDTNQAINLAREPGSSWHAQLSRLHALAGDPDRARQELENLARGVLRAHPENLAYTYLALGDRERALALLERAADERDPSLLWLGVDPRVDPLRGSPRFLALFDRLGIP